MFAFLKYQIPSVPSTTPSTARNSAPAFVSTVLGVGSPERDREIP